ncbi:MAG TPA: hypothetical protein VGP72_26955 [Planctomycetota bacterium]
MPALHIAALFGQNLTQSLNKAFGADPLWRSHLCLCLVDLLPQRGHVLFDDCQIITIAHWRHAALAEISIQIRLDSLLLGRGDLQFLVQQGQPRRLDFRDHSRRLLVCAESICDDLRLFAEFSQFNPDPFLKIVRGNAFGRASSAIWALVIKDAKAVSLPHVEMRHLPIAGLAANQPCQEPNALNYPLVNVVW